MNVILFNIKYIRMRIHITQVRAVMTNMIVWLVKLSENMDKPMVDHYKIQRL